MRRRKGPAAAVRCEVEGSEGGISVLLTTTAPTFYLTLDVGSIAGEFSDNCFTLIPGAPRTVRFTPRGKVTVDKLRKALTVRHLRDTYH